MPPHRRAAAPWPAFAAAAAWTLAAEAIVRMLGLAAACAHPPSLAEVVGTVGPSSCGPVPLAGALAVAPSSAVVLPGVPAGTFAGALVALALLAGAAVVTILLTRACIAGRADHALAGATWAAAVAIAATPLSLDRAPARVFALGDIPFSSADLVLVTGALWCAVRVVAERLAPP